MTQIPGLIVLLAGSGVGLFVLLLGLCLTAAGGRGQAASAAA